MELRHSLQRQRLKPDAEIAEASAQERTLEEYEKKFSGSKLSHSGRTGRTNELSVHVEVYRPCLPVQGTKYSIQESDMRALGTTSTTRPELIPHEKDSH